MCGIKKRFVFKSDTDTEILVRLIDFFHISNYLDLLTTVQFALYKVIELSSDHLQKGKCGVSVKFGRIDI